MQFVKVFHLSPHAQHLEAHRHRQPVKENIFIYTYTYMVVIVDITSTKKIEYTIRQAK